MNITPKQIDDIWLFEITAQFLLDHAEDNLVSEHWCTKRLKSSLKTTIDELKKVTSIPFTQKEIQASAETVQQQITGSVLAEQNMRLSLKFDQLNSDDQLRFQAQYENLLSRYNLLIF